MNEPSFTLSDDNELTIHASGTSSPDDFDFLQGNWTVHNRKLKSRLSGCEEWLSFDAEQEMLKVLGGKGNVDFMSTNLNGLYYEGMTLRLFNPVNKLWSIYWADNQHVTLEKPVFGSFEGPVGRFFCKDVFQGKEILVRFNWDASDPERPIWSQAFSEDKGMSWEWNWYMHFEKIS